VIFVSAKRVISVPSEQVIYFPAENVKEGFALFRLRSINKLHIIGSGRGNPAPTGELVLLS